MRGDLCPFDHGVDRIVVDDVPLNRPFESIIPMAATPLAGPVGMMGGGVAARPPFFMGGTGVRNQYEMDPGFCKSLFILFILPDFLLHSSLLKIDKN